MRRITFALAGIAALIAAVHVTGGPGPAAAGGPPEDAIAFFKRYIALGSSYDLALGDLYADSAVLRVTTRMPDGSSQEVQITGAQYRAVLPRTAAAAKRRGDQTVFFDIRYTAEGDRMRITATRYDVLGNYHVPHALVLARDTAGNWVIVEETAETQVGAAAGGEAQAVEPAEDDLFEDDLFEDDLFAEPAS